MKREEKVAEFLREEGYNVSEEDILIAQLIPSFYKVLSLLHLNMFF
ncbi:hypothetical protein HMPREF9093_02120 [Fusobacterium sp. oral taxon 370 str. F0437]|nr:hypothetical protein [Fusobacterium sp. oral taxon 370]EHI76228.1 hypothetical protein HMPREF9093_02120 [Fusobacterium sp. oral taxon 370 str. F0437]